MYIYLFGVKNQRGRPTTGAGISLCLSQRTSGESNPSDHLYCAHNPGTAQVPLSPSPDPPIHEIIFCGADVLDVIDYPPLSWGPESDLLGAFVRNQLGKNKNKNLKASSGWPEIRGPQSHLSLAWQNNLNNKKIHKKIFSFQGLERYSSFHPPCQHDTTPM